MHTSRGETSGYSWSRRRFSWNLRFGIQNLGSTHPFYARQKLTALPIKLRQLLLYRSCVGYLGS